MASASTISEGKQSSQRRRSCDTVCSSNSSCFLHKRKQTHPLASSLRTYLPRTSNNNVVKQRVLSARMLKLRSLQNQLNDANFHLAELQQENRALKNLQTRQDRALSRYEGTNADLPRLLQTHEEDIRVLTIKNKTLRKNIKDVTDQLKTREEELLHAREQVKNLATISKNKNLGERRALTEQVEDLKVKLKSSDEKINLLNRRIMLESKNYKFKLNAEVSKNKQLQKDLTLAVGEVTKLTMLLDVRGRVQLPNNNRKRFATANQGSSVSLINLTDNKSAGKQEKLYELVEAKASKSVESEYGSQSDLSDVRLEPITNDSKASSINDVMTSPSENIKARLSAGSIIKAHDIDHLSKCIEKVQILENSFEEAAVTSIIAPINKQASRPNSSKKLDSLALSLFEKSSTDATSSLNKMEEDIHQRLSKYSNDVMTTVKDCSALVDKHRKNFDFAKSETEKLLENLRETDTQNAKLKYGNFLRTESLIIPEKDMDIANQIWSDEFNFRKSTKQPKSSTNDIESFIKSDRNGNVTQDDKNKLLATLRAIDNGNEEIKFDPGRENKLMDELFADLHE